MFCFDRFAVYFLFINVSLAEKEIWLRFQNYGNTRPTYPMSYCDNKEKSYGHDQEVSDI